MMIMNLGHNNFFHRDFKMFSCSRDYFFLRGAWTLDHEEKHMIPPLASYFVHLPLCVD